MVYFHVYASLINNEFFLKKEIMLFQPLFLFSEHFKMDKYMDSWNNSLLIWKGRKTNRK